MATETQLASSWTRWHIIILHSFACQLPLVIRHLEGTCPLLSQTTIVQRLFE